MLFYCALWALKNDFVAEVILRSHCQRRFITSALASPRSQRWGNVQWMRKALIGTAPEEGSLLRKEIRTNNGSAEGCCAPTRNWRSFKEIWELDYTLVILLLQGEWKSSFLINKNWNMRTRTDRAGMFQEVLPFSKRDQLKTPVRQQSDKRG